jgi:hypothetical protein
MKSVIKYDICCLHIKQLTFLFNTSHQTIEDESTLVPIMDEYGFGMPYLFTMHLIEELPANVLYNYVDINFSQIAQQV